MRGHHSDAQGGREGGEGFPEERHVGLVPKGAQVSARQSRGPARPAEDTGDGEWCSRGNSGRTASARGPPPLPSPPPRPLRAASSLRDSPAFALGLAASQRPGSHCCRSHLSPAPGTPSPAPGAFCRSSPCGPYRQGAAPGTRPCGRSAVRGARAPGGSAGWRRVLRQHIPANLSHCPEASLGMWRLERSPLPVLVFGKATPRQRSHPRAGEGRVIPLARGRQVFPSRRGPK